MRMLLLFFLLVLQKDAFSILIQKAIVEMDHVIINTRKFGDYGNRSFIPYSVQLRDEQVWPDDSTGLDATRSGIAALHLAVVNNLLIADYGSELVVYEKNTGELQWKRSKGNNAEFDIYMQNIVMVSHAGFYQTFNMKGTLVESISMPSFSDNSRLLFSARFEEELYCLFNYFGSRSASPGEGSATANFTFVHYMTKNNMAKWGYVQRREMARWVCCTSDGMTILVASDHSLYSLPKDAEHNEQVAIKPFTRIEALSLLHNNELLLVDKNEKGRFLHCLKANGEIKTTLELERNGEIVQPVASTPEGEMYLSIGPDLFCFTSGKELWRYHFDFAPKPVLFTVLADKSVIAVCGHYFYQISSQGKKEFEKFLIPEPSCRPLADEKGFVYTAGPDGVVCFR